MRVSTTNIGITAEPKPNLEKNASVRQFETSDLRYQFKADSSSSHSVILSRLRNGAGRRLLDVGTAQGYLAELLAERGYEVTGIEADSNLAAVATARCHRMVIADLDEPLPELGGPFDVVVCGDVLEHLKDPARVLAELTQHLKPEGIAIISVPNIAHLWMRLQLLLGRFEYADRGILDRTHLRFFTLSSFRRFLGDAGLEISELLATPVPLPLVIPPRYQGRIFAVIHGFNAWLARLCKGLFAYQFVAVARKKVLS